MFKNQHDRFSVGHDWIHPSHARSNNLEYGKQSKLQRYNRMMFG